MVCSISEAWLHLYYGGVAKCEEVWAGKPLRLKVINNAGGECLFNAVLITEKRGDGTRCRRLLGRRSWPPWPDPTIRRLPAHPAGTLQVPG